MTQGRQQRLPEGLRDFDLGGLRVLDGFGGSPRPWDDGRHAGVAQDVVQRDGWQRNVELPAEPLDVRDVRQDGVAKRPPVEGGAGTSADRQQSSFERLGHEEADVVFLRGWEDPALCVAVQEAPAVGDHGHVKLTGLDVGLVGERVVHGRTDIPDDALVLQLLVF